MQGGPLLVWLCNPSVAPPLWPQHALCPVSVAVMFVVWDVNRTMGPGHCVRVTSLSCFRLPLLSHNNTHNCESDPWLPWYRSLGNKGPVMGVLGGGCCVLGGEGSCNVFSLHHRTESPAAQEPLPLSPQLVSFAVCLPVSFLLSPDHSTLGDGVRLRV